MFSAIIKPLEIFGNHGRRRNVRVAAQGKYYGSPGKEGEDGNRHILMEQKNWEKVDPRRQAMHNNKILDILNTGNAKLLAVGLADV